MEHDCPVPKFTPGPLVTNKERQYEGRNEGRNKVAQRIGRQRCSWSYPFPLPYSTSNSPGNREQKFSKKLVSLPRNSP